MRRRLRTATSKREKMLELAFSNEEGANQALLLNETVGVFSPKEVAQLERFWDGAWNREETSWWVNLLVDAGARNPMLSAFPEGRKMLKELTAAMAPLKKEIETVYEEHGFDVEVDSYSFDDGNSFSQGTAGWWVFDKADDNPTAQFITFFTYGDEDYPAWWAAGFSTGRKYTVLGETGPEVGRDFKSTVSKQIRYLRGAITQVDAWLDKHPGATLSDPY